MTNINTDDEIRQIEKQAGYSLGSDPGRRQSAFILSGQSDVNSLFTAPSGPSAYFE